MADPAAARVELWLDNRLEEIGRLVDTLQGFLDEHGLPATLGHRLAVVFDELLSNTINYGYPQGGAHQIRVLVELSGRTISILIEDDAVEFNPLDAPEPDLELGVEDRPIGGLGVHLVRTLMDSVSWSRDNGRNRLALAKTI